MNNLFETNHFRKLVRSLLRQEKQWLAKVKEECKQQVHGDILRYEWFLEKRFRDKRLYFLYDKRSKKVLFVAFANKKSQQAIIDSVVNNRREWLELLKNL